MEVAYVTGNKNKYENARKFLAEYSIDVVQEPLTLTEIQSDNCVEIATQKAKEAWAKLGRPLFVNDASWEIPVLGGFPGPYMKYINQWFKPIDFINLMQGKTDRTIILKDVIVYIDRDEPIVFTNEHRGTILEVVTLGEYRHPSDSVISLSKTGASILEEVNNGTFFIEDENRIWKDFASWVCSEGNR